MTAWALGWIVATVLTAAVVTGGRGLQRRVVPSWRGAPAVLAAAVAGLGLLVGTSLLLGSVGLFRRWALVVALVAVAWYADPRRRPFAPPRPLADDDRGTTAPLAVEDAGSDPRGRVTDARDPAYAEGPWSRVAATLTVLLLAVSWLVRVVAVYRRGNSDGDSLMYHLPFATRFLQTGWTTSTSPIGSDAWVAFYPATGELVEATVMLPWRSDALVPLVNLGWLALALLAGWCVGSTVGRPSLGLVLTAPVAALPVMTLTQAGTARVDVAVVALTLSSVALLLQEPRTTGSCALAGLALGLAVGTKLVVLPLAGALAVAVAAVLWRRRAMHQAMAWAAATIAGGGYWYVRNIVAAGNPVPAVDLRIAGVGFAPLPHDRLSALDGTSIIARMKEPWFYDGIALPVLRGVTSSLPVTLALIAAAAVPLVWVARKRPPGLPHALAAAAIVGGLGYLAAPNGVPLPPPGGSQESFASVIALLNVRYAFPWLAVLLLLLPLATGAGGRGHRAGEAVAVAATAWMAWVATRRFPFDTEWPILRRDVVVAASLVAVGVATHVVVRRRVADRTHQGGAATASARVLVALAVLGAIALTGWVTAGSSGLHRYGAAPSGLVALWRASDSLNAGRIALVDGWAQYPLSGTDLSTEVEYAGLPRDRNLSQPPRTCTELRQALRLGRYEAVVVQRGPFEVPWMVDSWDRTSCLMGIDGAHLVERNNDGALFRLSPSSPAGGAGPAA